ncbi:sensor histidine kinase [Paenibacillus sp. LjRoot153]|uniref:sensor histidine kinase n=1 Tax=Paenibacillus sp. LjRoot153 TaxID=3342270 RepID=UPI003ED16068
MINQLLLTRYLLILVPAIASMYLETYRSNDTYALFVLLFIGLTEIRRTHLPNTGWMLLLEIGCTGWMSYHYEGVWFISFFSTLLTYISNLNRQQQFGVLLLQLFVLNLSLQNQPSMYFTIANVLFIALAILSFQFQRMKKNKDDVELLYDQLRKQHYELDEARLQLMDYARKVENIAQTEERNRISHDLHDDLGHKLIRLKMMMEASLTILPSQPNKGTEMLRSVRDQLGESMELLRSTVRRLKPNERSLQSYSLSKLIEGLTRENAIDIELDIQGMPYDLYPSLEYILYRNAQEAISNAIRHGAATHIQITLHYAANQVTMQVSNNGTRVLEPTVKGLGLSGMEERIKVIGGQLLISNEEHFTVTTVLPAFRHNGVN